MTRRRSSGNREVWPRANAYAFGQRHVGRGFAQACRLDDLAFDPDAIGLPGDRFDRQPEQSEPVVRVFETRIGRDGRRQLEFSHQLLRIEVGSPVDELAGIGAVAGQAGAVREKLRDGGFGDLRMQALHILPDRIVQPQLALLPQLHDSGRGETLGMRSDPEAVARGQLFAGGEIGLAERIFGDHLAAMGNGDDAARPLRGAQLEFDPAAQISERGLHPWFHVRHS